MAKEANRVMEKALNSLIETNLPQLKKKGKLARLLNAERYYLLLMTCTDHLEAWLSYLKVETYDNRKKEENVEFLRETFRGMDIEFHKDCPINLNHFDFATSNKGLRRVSKAVWTEQRKKILEEYKPNHGRADIEIMAEIACINQTGSDDVYVVSEDRHFYAKRTREMIKGKYNINCRRTFEMLEGGLIRKLMQDAS